MNKLPQRFDALALGGERRLGIHPLRDRQRVGRIELIVQIGMDQQDRAIVRVRMGHNYFLSNLATSSIRAWRGATILAIATSVTLIVFAV